MSNVENLTDRVIQYLNNRTKWDKRFMAIAIEMSKWSKDPSTQVGCVIYDDEKNQLSGGFNGFPRGICDDDRLIDRETKIAIIVHAEANAVAAAARNGHSLKGATAYGTKPPCTQCASLLIQAGIKRVVVIPWTERQKERWGKNSDAAKNILIEAGVHYDVLDLV